MIKSLWKVIDKLELVATDGFFDRVAERIELRKAILMLKEIIDGIQKEIK